MFTFQGICGLHSATYMRLKMLYGHGAWRRCMALSIWSIASLGVGRSAFANIMHACPHVLKMQSKSCIATKLVWSAKFDRELQTVPGVSRVDKATAPMKCIAIA